MKTLYAFSIYKITLLFLFLSLSFGYSQEKTSNKKTLFGVPVKNGSVNPRNGIIRCATTEYEESLQAKNPKRMSEIQFEAWLTPLVNRQKALRTTSQSGGIITIPVVVHVIYKGQNIGVAPNITDTQVLSQIKVLNEDFRRMIGTPGFNTNNVGADTQIQFELAQVDPSGNPTNGIDRVSLCQDVWAENEVNETVKPSTIWDPMQYLNMWTVQFSDTTILGYAQFPDASGLEGLDSSGGSSNTDGVVSNYNVFGSRTYDDGTFILQSPYDQGRTMTHEVGHWLGLRHIWGDGNGDEEKNIKDCEASDYCEDTPQVAWQHSTCGTFDTCPLSEGKDMPENYMDYTPDACMNIFTQNQKDRITTIINNATRRSTLKTSTKNSPIPLFANDGELKLEASCENPICGISSNQTILKLIIYNRGTTVLTSATIDYKINGGRNIIYNWSGNLATHKSDVISIVINSATDGDFSAAINKVNGVSDSRTTNNFVSGSFLIPTTPANYPYTNYIYNLQLDNWGSETSWNLKNDAGEIVFSGGPYSDTEKSNAPLPALITENWKLMDNKCYTFTINDTEGDGICCEGGKGYYDIKASDGTIITSGASYKSLDRYTFSIGTTRTNEFESSNAIYLFPNPSTAIVNILIPNTMSLPTSYTISNVLGQIISQKNILKEVDLGINTSEWSSGIYFITIQKNDEKRTMRFIKE